ncbi:heme peroxidase, partial [Leucosporidium creatinivorum]
MLLEQVVIMLSTLPPNSDIGTSLTNTLIRFLWADLDHPPVAYVGANRYRQADGSGNSPWDVQLGASHTAYARSVPPMHPLPPNLPDPGTLFDALLKRDEFVPHPSGISSLLFNFATTIIHSCFQTSLADPNINEASSYLDLSIIYGNNQDEQNKVRTGKLGLMHPDVVSSSRLFLMPAAVTTLAVVFTRNHNLIAEKLLAINEGDRPDVVKYKEDTEKDPKGLVQQDEDLFQTARLVNCGWFLWDYIRAILNINRSNSLWSLVPTGVIRPPLQGPFPRGVGNAVAVEFNILYRWHAAISAQDEEWIEMEMKKWGPRGKQPVDYTEEDFFTVYFNMTKALGESQFSPLLLRERWNIPGIKRKSDGYFEDRDLVNILSAATTNVAGAFKARGSPAAMRIIDMMGISAARSTWGTCSLNEFRKFLGLEQFTEFKQWNSDPKIVDIASQLYTHVDNIELFPGLLAEEAKPSMPGSGLGPGYTVSRAILSDAAALVRGDRYLTLPRLSNSMNANNFTVYQFEELTPDLEGGSFGGVLGKLFMRVFPEQYAFNSAYALFAFSTPATTEDILRKLGIKQQY